MWPNGDRESATNWVRRLNGIRDLAPDMLFPHYQVIKVHSGGGKIDVQAGTHKMYEIIVEGEAPELGQVPLIGADAGDKGRLFTFDVANVIAPPLEVIPVPWSCSRGNSQNNFVSGLPGPMISLSDTPRQLDTFTLNGSILGILYYPSAGKTLVALKTTPGPGTSGYADLFYASDSTKKIEGAGDYQFKERITYAFSPFNTFSNWLYCEDLGTLVWISISSFSTQITVLDALTGSTTGAAPITNGDLVAPITSVTISSLNAYEGAVICRKMLVKTFRAHSYVHNFSAHTTADNANINARSIVGLSLPGGAVAWRWDPNTIWDNSPTIPYLRELCPLADIANAGFSDSGGQHQGRDYPWPDVGLGPAILLPGHPGVFLKGEIAKNDLIAFPLTGRVICSEETSVWTNPDFPTQERIRKPVDTQQTPPNDVMNPGLITAMSLGVFTPMFKVVGGNFATISTPGSGGGDFKEYQIGSQGYPRFGRMNSTSLHAWIVALDPATGEAKWKYEFPTLVAAEHYLVDTDSFSRVASSPWIAAWLASATSATTTPTATPSSSIVHPGQVKLSTYNNVFDRQYSVNEDSLENHLYWPTGAAYYFDPMFFTRTGDNSSGVASHSNLVADQDSGFLYGVYLQPMIVVSCADIWHRSDASVADRTHSADTAYSTRNNGYESDRLTVKANQVDVWAKIDFGAVIEPFPVGLVSRTFDATFFGDPHKLVCFKSFLGKWSRTGELLWTRELTTYHDETIDSSPGLDGKIPYPGLTIRICPTSAGVFLLRLERLPIQTSIREAALLPSHQYRVGSPQAGGQTLTDFVAHAFNSRAVLELRDTNGDLIWQKVVFDPTDLTPIWLCSASMFASETDATGNPWVIGRVDFSKNHSAKTLWMDSSPVYESLTRVSKVFACDASGTIMIRDAEAEDMDSQGLWPRDFNHAASYSNGRLRQQPSLLMEGVLRYPVGPSDFKVWAMGDS